MLGDSFTEGYSVNSNENIEHFLSKNFQQVINMGKSGNGTLLEYATLIEYAKSYEPEYLIILYCQNDIINLRNELGSSTLRKYLNEPEFKQNLIDRQKEIDQTIIKFYNSNNNYLHKIKTLYYLKNLTKLSKEFI